MTNQQYKHHLEQMEGLLQMLTKKGKLTKQQQLQLDEVSDCVQEYEEKYHAFKPDNLVEMIELRMYQRKLKQKDLAELLETSPSRISEFMNGKRKLTMEMAKALYQKLNIDPEFILKQA